MADEKKPDSKAPKTPIAPVEPTDPFVEIVWLLLSLLVVVYLLNRLFVFLSSIFTGDAGVVGIGSWSLWIHDFFIRLFSYFSYFQLFAYIITVLLVMIIVIIYKNLTVLRTNERKLMYPEMQSILSAKNPQWERVLAHTESLNENDWRLAIMEADIMLDDLLNKLSLSGETIGEKLKSVEKSDFLTIDNAWEAHKIRNQIAHEGQAFALNQREAKRVIGLYRDVFEEFQTI
ncbi:hypothetical protein H0W91_04235 [Patescibacteria group bacterium]|nr:hypothetical protein [Patescibacteria group bacterium]